MKSEKNKNKTKSHPECSYQFFVCVDDIPEKIEKVALKASEIFDVQLEKNLTLLTIRHYTGEFLNKLTENKTIVLQQKTMDTIQLLMRDI